MKKHLFPAIFLLVFFNICRAQTPGDKPYISTKAGIGNFCLSAKGLSAPLLTGKTEYPGALIAIKNLQADITAVTKATPIISNNVMAHQKEAVIIGTIGKNELIDNLIRLKKLNVDSITGKWEAHITQVVKNPFPGVDKALVIAGSDKRGTIYGIYELSAQIGVSPWYWWADVPVKQQKSLYVLPGQYVDGGPAIKYRGIFINDEAPSFTGWAKEKFGGVNHFAYEKVFELILRLKGNYLWPAMWGNAFNDDDKLDPVLADEYGIVMGTSHHEPMDRAQQEWKRYGTGSWNYETNGEELRTFWKKGIENMGSKETIVTIGMRGDGDMPMTVGSNITLLEKIVADQRKIIADVTGKDASQTPQMWALYKEVQDYYDRGMRVPDDVTLLLCDDNWGNIRKLPNLNEHPRKGGYGIYYHFDYVGDPRNYKWLNTNQISKTWEQMHLAYEYGAKQVWIVNVGDLKPMEYPISFFMDYAWNPDKWPASSLNDYPKLWATQQFGPEHADKIAKILNLYTKYNARRKPEQLDQNTYSLTNYHEFETVVNDYNALAIEAKQLGDKLPTEYRDAYFELVLHPVEACANLNQLYYDAAKNQLYGQSKLAAANHYANLMADSVKFLFKQDSLISDQYNKKTANGKWDHMMDQTHIGYTGWQQPDVNKMPDIIRIASDTNQKKTAHNIIRVRLTAPSNDTLSINGTGFYEHGGYISMEAEHFAKTVSSSSANWIIIPNYGRTLSGVMPSPVTMQLQTPGGNGPHLEYEINLADTGIVKVEAYISPTLDFNNTGGLRYAISIDDEHPQIINTDADRSDAEWRKNVSDNIKIPVSNHHITKPGKHVLKYWMVDPAVVLQKIVIDAGGEQPSYLGPPESYCKE